MNSNQKLRDKRYKVVNERLVAMSKDDEYQWLYDNLMIEVLKVLETQNINKKELFEIEGDNIQKVKLPLLITIANSLGIDCESVENNERYFHLTDKYGNTHGFDIRYFETRSPSILNSFAAIILEYFDCGSNNVLPIMITSYPDSLIGDAIILVSNLPGLQGYAEIMDYTHPKYTLTMQKLHANKSGH